VPLTVNAISF